MNAKSIITAAALLAVSVGASAQEFVPADTGFQASRTRAEVVEELHAARSAGLLSVHDGDYPRETTTATAKTREEVKAELATARKERTTGSVNDGYPATLTISTKSRREVRAELEQARKDGSLASEGSLYVGGA